jgi:hypothetical protein
MPILLEVVLNARDLTAVGIDSRDELEDALIDALAESGIAEVSGGGAGVECTILMSTCRARTP